MNTILIPIDFSDVSRKAIEYAQLISQKLHLDITLLHVMNIPSVAVHSSLAFDSDISKDARDAAENQLREWCQRFSGNDVKCSWMLREGFVVDSIVDVEKEISPDLIILGTTGTTGWMGKLIGSNASAVIQRVSSAVLLVPHEAPVKEFKHILYATQLEMIETEVLRKVFHWAHLFNGHADLIKVNTQFQLDIFSDNYIIEELRRLFPAEQFSIFTETAQTTIKGIDHYLESHPVDLIVMTTTRKSFIERLFDGNVTRQMAMHTQLPLLVYHFRED
jgi:nucleotide-binding universal stress UspA family protein